MTNAELEFWKAAYLATLSGPESNMYPIQNAGDAVVDLRELLDKAGRE